LTNKEASEPDSASETPETVFCVLEESLRLSQEAGFIDSSDVDSLLGAYLASWSVTSKMLVRLGASQREQESARAAIANAAMIGFRAGRDPQFFRTLQATVQRQRAENARVRKLPKHLLDRIVIEEMEDPRLPAAERADPTKARRKLLAIAEKKQAGINAGIATERKRYNLSTKRPYFQAAESVCRRYLQAKARTAI
jgi:hypothetical protein